MSNVHFVLHYSSQSELRDYHLSLSQFSRRKQTKLLIGSYRSYSKAVVDSRGSRVLILLPYSQVSTPLICYSKAVVDGPEARDIYLQSIVMDSKGSLTMEMAAFAFNETKAEYLKCLENVSKIQLDMAERNAEMAQKIALLARERHLQQRKEWELFQLRFAHSLCPKPAEEAQDGPDPVSLPEDWQEAMSAMARDMVEKEAMLNEFKAKFERLGVDLQAAQEDLQTLMASEHFEHVKEEFKQLEEVHKECTSRISGDFLPEALLLQIFDFLPWPQLVKIGGVSTTWLRVSQDRMFHKQWRDADIHVDMAGPEFGAAIVRQSPLWKRLFVPLVDETSYEGIYQALLDREQGTVPTLHIEFTADKPTDLQMEMLRKHRTDMRNLYLEDNCPPSNLRNRVCSLWDIIKDMHQLQELTVEGSRVLLTEKSEADLSNLRLEKFVIDNCDTSAKGVVPKILSASCNSLKSLLCHYSTYLDFNEINMTLFPNLRELELVVVPGMQVLQHLKYLEKLTLHSFDLYFPKDVFWIERTNMFFEVVNVLNGDLADRLISLSLRDVPADFFDAGNIVLPNLKSLTLSKVMWFDPSHFKEMLLFFPRLEQLEVHPVLESDLEMLTPDVVPNLKELILDEEFSEVIVPPVLNSLQEQRPHLKIKSVTLQEG